MLRVLRQAVGDNASLSWTWCALAMGFPPCLSRKRPSYGLGVRSRWAFPSACRGKGCLVDLARACDGLFSPASRGKGYLMDLAMSYSPCLSRKRPSHGLGARLRWSFRPACRGKGLLMDSSGVIDRAKCFEVTTGCGDFKSLDREQERALGE